MNELILLAIGFVAAFVGSMSGGGAALITVATLLHFGLPINQTLATNKFGNLGFYLPALRNYSKAKYIKKKALPAIISINLAGVALGTFLIVHLNSDLLKKIVAVILVIIVISSLLKKHYATTERPARWYWSFIYFGSSISSGAVGAGTGILSTVTLIYFRGFNALQAAAHYFYANALGNLLSVSILLFTPLINYRYGFYLIIGNIIGAHLGSKIAINKGDEFVRLMIILLATCITIQLFFF